jgi:hypothetical protein
MEYIEYHNEDQSPFIWTAQACDILEKVTRAKGKLLNQESAAWPTLVHTLETAKKSQ